MAPVLATENRRLNKRKRSTNKKATYTLGTSRHFFDFSLDLRARMSIINTYRVSIVKYYC
jgi:hypothetical protein